MITQRIKTPSFSMASAVQVKYSQINARRYPIFNRAKEKISDIIERWPLALRFTLGKLKRMGWKITGLMSYDTLGTSAVYTEKYHPMYIYKASFKQGRHIGRAMFGMSDGEFDGVNLVIGERIGAKPSGAPNIERHFYKLEEFVKYMKGEIV